MHSTIFEKVFRVADLPDLLRDALNERGKFSNSEITLRDAVAEYTAWHTGDRALGYEIAKAIESCISE